MSGTTTLTLEGLRFTFIGRPAGFERRPLKTVRAYVGLRLAAKNPGYEGTKSKPSTMAVLRQIHPSGFPSPDEIGERSHPERSRAVAARRRQSKCRTLSA